MNKPHVHAEFIKAWADGIPIQIKGGNNDWFDVEPPSHRKRVPEFNKGAVYRIKPEPSDLEKYGIEVGDVWEDPYNRDFTVLVVEKDGVTTLLRNKVPNWQLDSSTLLFRRGVVNKL